LANNLNDASFPEVFANAVFSKDMFQQVRPGTVYCCQLAIGVLNLDDFCSIEPGCFTKMNFFPSRAAFDLIDATFVCFLLRRGRPIGLKPAEASRL
jgi:hypothetical protein